MSTSPLLGLPVDILVIIFPYLDISSFLNLTSTCKALHNPDFVFDRTFWSSTVRTTFRVPNRPAVENDGRRWQKLCVKLLTQSRIYTWGNNERGCLGHSYGPVPVIVPPSLRTVHHMRRRHSTWPEKMQGVERLGIISDLQCGGWATTMLTHKGALYATGVIDGLDGHQARSTQTSEKETVALKFPPGFVPPSERYDSSTAIAQFSTGRQHVLGLSDSGRIWSWQNLDHAALTVKFLDYNVVEKGLQSGPGVVRQVAAGWNKSAALIEGVGIVLWEPLKRDNNETGIEDAALILESAVVPRTNYWQSSQMYSDSSNKQTVELAETVGEVRNFVLLEDVVLFRTHLGKVFVAEIVWDDQTQRVSNPIELPLTDGADATPDDAFSTDLQGSFRSLAVFTRSGAVLTGSQDRLKDFIKGTLESSRLFSRIPALQNTGVIQVAFGDYHFHALHSQGHITSYGVEPQGRGALGLGGDGDGEARLRGIRYQGRGGDGVLVPHAYAEGRRVWFEKEKRAWVKYLTSGGVNPAESIARQRMAIGSPDVRCQGEVSEWVEQQGRDWESKFGVSTEDDDGLGAYFALSVAAAGWHSGALVLVNDDLATKLTKACEIPDPSFKLEVSAPSEASSSTAANVQVQAPAQAASGEPSNLLGGAVNVGIDYGRWFFGMPPYNEATTPGRNNHAGNGSGADNAPALDFVKYGAAPRAGFRYVWADDHFPRLVLSDGTEMPGTVPFDEWRCPRPEWDLEAHP